MEDFEEEINNKNIHFINKDAKEIDFEDEDEVFVLMFEILDNLTHDLIQIKDNKVE